MILPIPRYPDSLVLAKFAKIGEQLATREWKLTARSERWEMFSVTCAPKGQDPWSTNTIAIEMSKGSGISTRGFSFSVDGQTVASIERPDNEPQDRLTLDANWYGDGAEANRLRFARSSEAIGTEFTVSRSTNQFVSSTGELAKFVESRDQGLARLEELYSKLTRELIEDRERSVAELAAKKRELDELERKLRSDAEAERNMQALETAKEREALAAKLKEVDMRAATVARRQIRKDLKDEFKKRQTEFGVTPDTQKKRGPVAKALILLAAVLGVGFAFYAVDFVVHPPSGDVMIVAIIRQTLLGVAFAGAVWFYIHWQNAWFQRHADEEFKLKRLELDFDRASWVVELAMEWSKEKTGHEIPDAVLRELTRGLFSDSGPSAQGQKRDVFSALLDASTKAEIAVGDAKFALNRNGAKKLKDALSEQE